jgi:hypothetical protein
LESKKASQLFSLSASDEPFGTSLGLCDTNADSNTYKSDNSSDSDFIPKLGTHNHKMHTNTYTHTHTLHITYIHTYYSQLI